MKKPTGKSDLAAIAMLCLSLMFAAYGYGIVSYTQNLFPYPQFKEAILDVTSLIDDRLPWYYLPSPRRQKVAPHRVSAIAPGLTLVSSIGRDRQLSVKVVNTQGEMVHSWNVDWFKVWPDSGHVPEKDRPKSRPGTNVHGMAVMHNGDLLLNYDHLGMVRFNVCSDVLWRLPRGAHHSIHQDEQGYFWVPGEIWHHKATPRLPNHLPPFIEPTIMQISPSGKIVREISVLNILIKNGLTGLLYMSTIHNDFPKVTGDTLHLNDVELFPSSLPEGVFKHGDIMASLRNINTIIVFDPEVRRIKFKSVGRVLRQHDPDFVDGNTISIFDNNNLATDSDGHYSRIVTLSAKDHRLEVIYTGTDERPFFTSLMGKHQWLANGNMLITESKGGNAFEIDSNGTIVWEYINSVGDGIVGLMSEAQRLPPSLDTAFFKKASRACAPSGT